MSSMEMGNIGKIFKEGMGQLDTKFKDLDAQMTAVLKADSIDQGAMLNLQFEMGQYNAALESLSNVTKSMTDMLKTLSQRTG